MEFSEIFRKLYCEAIVLVQTNGSSYFVSDKPLDWKTIDLKKMRVKELKNILNDWGEVRFETYRSVTD